jgi:hypothetical protein
LALVLGHGALQVFSQPQVLGDDLFSVRGGCGVCRLSVLFFFSGVCRKPISS